MKFGWWAPNKKKKKKGDCAFFFEFELTQFIFKIVSFLISKIVNKNKILNRKFDNRWRIPKDVIILKFNIL